MKTIQFNKLWTLLLALVVVTSCVKTDDFDMPNLNIEEPNINPDAIVEISSVAGALAQSSESMYTYNDTDTYMVGYVISNDDGGNFFKQLILQDKPENPTVGIKVLLDESPLHITYEVGRRVYIKLDGLTVGESNGVLALGVRGSVRPERIPYPSISKHVLRSAQVATIVPKPLTIEEFSNANTNLMIRLTDLQFSRSELNKTFASEPFDEFDGERQLVSCVTNANAVLNTSTFARFKGVRVPSGRGNMDAILVKSFNGADFRLYVNDPSTIYFESEDRCDPFDCDGPSGGPDTLISEGFENISNLNELSGWINVNTSGGNRIFVLGNFSGNNYAQISAFGSNEDVVEAWLVTPELDFDSFENHLLDLDIEAAHDNGKILTVLITENFTGDVTTTDWQELGVEVPTGPSSGFGGLQSVPSVNVSCFEGNVRIAFRYLGSANGPSTRYHIDNVRITGIQN